MRMHPRLLCRMAVLCPLLVVISPGALAIANPYQAIVDRNVFALKDPPPPPPPAANDKPAGPPITLTGITTILGTKRAFMNFQLAAKPPEPPKSMSLMLTEGQRDGEVEVIQIDEKAGSVKVNAFGENRTLTFSTNSTKGGSAPIAQMGANPGAGHVFTPGGGAAAEQKSIPTRMMRLPGTQPGSPGGSPAPATGVPGNPTGVSFVPGQTTYADASQAPAQAERPNTPEENLTLYEANRIRNEEARKAGAVIMPTPPNPYARAAFDPATGQPTTQSPGMRLPYAPTIQRGLPPQ